MKYTVLIMADLRYKAHKKLIIIVSSIVLGEAFYQILKFHTCFHSLGFTVALANLYSAVEI